MKQSKERMEAFIKEALAAATEIDRTDEVYRAEDVHAELERLAKGGKPVPPQPWLLQP